MQVALIVQHKYKAPANQNLKLSDPQNLACVSPTDLDIVPYLLVWTARHVRSVGEDCLD